MNTPSVLVIDDEPNNFDVIETFLSTEDYQLHYAPGGKEAIEFLETLAPDVILLDVMMPGMDGIEVCQKIKATVNTFIPVIIVTALNGKDDLARCLNAGADDFISKPVNALELRARLSANLRSKQQYDRIETFSRLQRDTINVLGRNLEELTDSIAMSFPHELNTPLNGIIGIIDLLRSGFGTMKPETVHQMLDLLDGSARRLENLTQKFLIYLELEVAGNQSPGPESSPHPYDVHELKSVLRDLARQYGREADLRLDLEEAPVTLPEKYLTTLFTELVDNAFKCSRADTEIAVKATVADGGLCISVRDSGWGMTEEQIATIHYFRQFERQLHEQQGLGLGLKIVQNIIKLAGGKLSIDSIYGRGTTVNVFLPVARGRYQG